MKRQVIAPLGLLAAQLLSACGAASQPDRACVPGQSIECFGAGGCVSNQVCKDDGSGYGPCNCGAPTPVLEPCQVTGGCDASGGTTSSSGVDSGIDAVATVSTGDDAAPPPLSGCALATFDAGAGVDGFSINTYHDTATTNLGDPLLGLAMKATLTWDGTQGNPMPGSLTAYAPYSGANQYLDIQNSTRFGLAHPQDWHGGTMHVRIKADQMFGGGVQVYVVTTSTYSFGGTHTFFNSGAPAGAGWSDFMANLDVPLATGAGYDPTKVIIFGIQLTSDQAGAAQEPVTFHIDSFSVSGIAACPQ